MDECRAEGECCGVVSWVKRCKGRRDEGIGGLGRGNDERAV